MNLFRQKQISSDDIAKILDTDPAKLKAFEQSYQKNILTQDPSENFFEVNAKQMAKEKEGVIPQTPVIQDMINRIVQELLNRTVVWTYKNGNVEKKKLLSKIENPVTNEEILNLPEDLRPQLTGSLMQVDMKMPSYIHLIDMYQTFRREKNSKKRQLVYGMFRQGLDILDLDDITVQMIATNPNSMGHWLPQIAKAASVQDFLKIPNTTIISVPTPMLQLTRLDYMSLTRTTLDIVDQFCKEVFELDENKEYFIKTGTYSSKFDFRNAHVHGAKEVRELGEYLLFIHHQACQMASPMNNKCIYGVSTTNEWVVRDFIPDKENAVCIYKGLPLHTEYRIFVDFDTKELLGSSPYWEPNIMKKRFGHSEDSNSPHNIHDYITFSSAEEKLMERYQKNIEKVEHAVLQLVEDTEGLSGQWSIDIMQNGDDFWLIDMALAANSALSECIPDGKLKPVQENWLPKIP